MGKFKDLTGMKFERLMAVERKGRSKNGHVLWLCKCTCGEEVVVDSSSLKNGNTKSCGCLHLEKATSRISNLTLSHGMSRSKIYRIWVDMKTRCVNPHKKSYKNYGGRGIMVCEEWLSSFDLFYGWALDSGYVDGLSIDRIDVNGNYSSHNCRWVELMVQQRNKRTNFMITHNNETKCLVEWANEYDLSPETLSSRIKKYKMNINDALTRPLRIKKTP